MIVYAALSKLNDEDTRLIGVFSDQGKVWDYLEDEGYSEEEVGAVTIWTETVDRPL